MRLNTKDKVTPNKGPDENIRTGTIVASHPLTGWHKVRWHDNAHLGTFHKDDLKKVDEDASSIGKTPSGYKYVQRSMAKPTDPDKKPGHTARIGMGTYMAHLGHHPADVEKRVRAHKLTGKDHLEVTAAYNVAKEKKKAMKEDEEFHVRMAGYHKNLAAKTTGVVAETHLKRAKHHEKLAEDTTTDGAGGDVDYGASDHGVDHVMASTAAKAPWGVRRDYHASMSQWHRKFANNAELKAKDHIGGDSEQESFWNKKSDHHNAQADAHDHAWELASDAASKNEELDNSHVVFQRSDTYTIIEGWMKHGDGSFSADAAEIDHHGKAPRCPSCRSDIHYAKDLKPIVDAENETTHWKGNCPKCKAGLTVFNDSFEGPIHPGKKLEEILGEDGQTVEGRLAYHDKQGIHHSDQADHHAFQAERESYDPDLRRHHEERAAWHDSRAAHHDHAYVTLARKHNIAEDLIENKTMRHHQKAIEKLEKDDTPAAKLRIKKHRAAIRELRKKHP